MPAALTHYFVAKKARRRCSDASLDVLLRCADAYFLGSAGPDFFFFSLFSKTARNMGSTLHKEGIRTFFRAAIHYAARARGKAKDVLFAYLSGFICHYMSDCAAHPYIFYKTGFSDESGSISGEFAGKHHSFETAADCIICKRYTGKDPARLKLYRAFSCSRQVKSIIAKMYKRSVRLAYGKKIPGIVYIRSMSDFVNFYGIVNDRFGVKRFLVSKVERLANRDGAISSLIHSKTAGNRIEVMNHDKNEWCVPWDNSAVSKKSLAELLNDSVAFAAPLINRLYICLYEGGDIPSLLEQLGNNSFHTGMEATLKPAFLYMEGTDEG